MLACSEVWIREALLSAAVKVAMPAVLEIENSVVSWVDGIFEGCNEEQLSIDEFLKKIAIDSVGSVISDVIANDSKFEGVDVKIDNSKVFDEEGLACLLSAEDVETCLWYGFYNDCWFYRTKLFDGTEKFIVLS